MKLPQTLAATAIAGFLAASAAATTLTPADAATATPYIIGGTQAQSEWIVQLEFQTHTNGPDETFGCTGEQLNDEWVLTARHCIDDVASMNVYQSNDQTRRGTPIAVDTVHAAPSGDIALVHLSQESPLRSYARVNANYTVNQGDTGSIYGYGLGANSQPTTTLRSANVSVTGNSTDAYGGPAAHLRGINGAANHGDSGGPLIVNGIVVAVCSTGDETDLGANINATSNYALLSQAANWIETTSGVDVTPSNGSATSPITGTGEIGTPLSQR